MRIAAAPADYDGCGTYRILLPFRALREFGHEVTFVNNPADPRILMADLLVVQRQTSPVVLSLVRTCRARGIPVMYELDDHLHAVPPDNPTSTVYGTGKPATKMIESFLREVDALIVSTEELARAYGRFNSRIFVCENAIDDRHAASVDPGAMTGSPKRDGEIRIGWAGSNTHRGDLAIASRAIMKLMLEDERIRFVTIGDSFAHLFPLSVRSRVEFVWGTATAGDLNLDHIEDSLLGIVRYYAVANRADFDIAIAPLAHTTFNRCKSDLKLKEYGILGVPAVATRFGPYIRYQERSERPIVLLADDELEWELALRSLVNSPQLRMDLGRSNRAHVLDHRLLSSGLQAWQAPLLAGARLAASGGPASLRNVLSRWSGCPASG